MLKLLAIVFIFCSSLILVAVIGTVILFFFGGAVCMFALSDVNG